MKTVRVRISAVLAAAALLPLLCGCGTIIAGYGSGCTENYGGVRLDKETFDSIRSGMRDGTSGTAAILSMPLVLIDVPFSAVADTIILPYTAPRARRAAEKEAAQQPRSRRK